MQNGQNFCFTRQNITSTRERQKQGFSLDFGCQRIIPADYTPALSTQTTRLMMMMMMMMKQQDLIQLTRARYLMCCQRLQHVPVLVKSVLAGQCSDVLKITTHVCTHTHAHTHKHAHITCTEHA